MDKKWIILVLAFLVSGTLVAQQKTVTLEDVWQRYAFFPQRVAGFNFLNDGKHYARMERGNDGTNIVEYDITTGKQSGVIFEGKQMTASDEDLSGAFDSYTFSADERKIILSTEAEAIYRRSRWAHFYVWDRDKEALTPVSEGGKQRDVAFNAQADKVAFARDNNLFYKDLASGEEVQITTDGEENAIINGTADWVYEEEFSITRLFEWSPDGKRIAFLRSDESAVPEFTMQMYRGELYPEDETFKYPKAGEVNATLTLHIYDLATKKVTNVGLGEKPDMYIPRIKWTKTPNSLCVFHMNRHQNELELILVDATTGNTRSLLKETNKYYVDIHDDLTFLKDGSGFIWTSEQDGYNHIYLYGMDGKLKKQITEGDFEVTAFYGIDEDAGKLYFQSAEVSPLERHIYSINLDGRKKKKLSDEAGTHGAQFSRTFDYYVDSYSSANAPNTSIVYNEKGKKVRVIEDNQAFKERMKGYVTSPVEFFSFETSEAVSLNGYMIKPPDFDESKQYPVFMFVYGGPGSQMVRDSWLRYYGWFQMLAQKGYIVACVDNRGTGGRGEEFKKMTYLQLGKYETIDQIEAGRYLASLPYTDANRIGIWGWSYGGYMSSLCLFKGNDVFSMAIAVAPVTNWKWYDTIYTERYMRTPAENNDGYEDNSPVNFADGLKGKYLLIHGTGDDNVHAQNSFEMVRALIDANKQFDNYFYPNRNHGIGVAYYYHLFTKMTDFIEENL